MSEDENQSIGAEMASMRTRVAGIENSVSRIETNIGKLFEASERKNKTDWTLIIGLLTFCAILIGGGWTIIRLETSNAIGPVIAQQAVSSAERAQEWEKIGGIDGRVAAQESSQAALDATVNARLTEVETQFRAEDQVRNVQTASTQRFLALLWQKANPGETFPPEVYYPEIAK